MSPSPSPTAADVAANAIATAALAVAILAALISVVSLLWSINEWRLSGGRVKVELSIIVRNPGRSASSIIDPPRRGSWKAESAPPTHVDYSIVFARITARNVGRTAVDIEQFFVTVGKIKNNKKMAWTFKDDPPLPHRLEPNTSESREYMIHDVEAFVRREKERRFRGMVALGNGTYRRSRLSFDIDDDKRGQGFLASATGQLLSTPAPSETH